ncbi:ATP-binding cassette domain-containing protein [Nakamurella silvestris]|nr:ATP-binding cassette domain-containing protein [Nakamurella silvestris]
MTESAEIGRGTTGTAGMSVRGLGVRYGHAVALAGLDLDFAPGRINAVVGPNGAGKSSLLLALYGAVPATGTITVGGRDLAGMTSAHRARAGIGLVPQGRQIFPTLSVRENLEVFAEVIRTGPGSVTTALSRFPRLVERAGTRAGNLSGGEQQMLAVTRALMTDCAVLLLDEMATGLAPVIVQQLMAVARELADGGTTVIMAEASIGAIVGDIDRGVVLIRGVVGGEATGGHDLDQLYRTSMGLTP